MSTPPPITSTAVPASPAPGPPLPSTIDLLVGCCRPVALSAADSDTWLHEALRGLLADTTITQIEIVALTQASARWPRASDYLIRVTLHASTARDAIAAPAFDGLLHDLRTLGMRPCVALGDPARVVTLQRGAR